MSETNFEICIFHPLDHKKSRRWKFRNSIYVVFSANLLEMEIVDMAVGYCKRKICLRAKMCLVSDSLFKSSGGHIPSFFYILPRKSFIQAGRKSCVFLRQMVKLLQLKSQNETKIRHLFGNVLSGFDRLILHSITDLRVYVEPIL